MKARLIKNSEGEFLILCGNGTIAKADKLNLHKMLKNFRQIDEITGEENVYWNKEYPEMNMYPGEEHAMVTDAYQLVISDFTPFSMIFTDSTKVVSVSTYSKLVGKSTEQIKIHCRNGLIPGAVKIGRDWVIPENAPYPKNLSRNTSSKSSHR